MRLSMNILVISAFCSPLLALIALAIYDFKLAGTVILIGIASVSLLMVVVRLCFALLDAINGRDNGS
jgi:hypothetical protein